MACICAVYCSLLQQRYSSAILLAQKGGDALIPKTHEVYSRLQVRIFAHKSNVADGREYETSNTLAKIINDFESALEKAGFRSTIEEA